MEACYGATFSLPAIELTYSTFKKRITANRPIVTENGLPTVLKNPHIEALNNTISKDKKNRASGIRFVLMQSLGNAQTKEGIDEFIINALWKKVGAI